MKGIKSNSQPVKNKKIEKTHAKEKQLHAQDSIYVVSNLPTSTELQGYHYYQGRIQSTISAATIFSLYT